MQAELEGLISALELQRAADSHQAAAHAAELSEAFESERQTVIGLECDAAARAIELSAAAAVHKRAAQDGAAASMARFAMLEAEGDLRGGQRSSPRAHTPTRGHPPCAPTHPHVARFGISASRRAAERGPCGSLAERLASLHGMMQSDQAQWVETERAVQVPAINHVLSVYLPADVCNTCG